MEFFSLFAANAYHAARCHSNVFSEILIHNQFGRNGIIELRSFENLVNKFVIVFLLVS